MPWSNRLDLTPLNRLSQHRHDLLADGFELTDLTDSNPTRHGLFDAGLLDIIASQAGSASRYQPTPAGPWPARAALAERFGGDPDDYWLTASTSEAYSWLFTILADPGDWLAIPRPGYPLIEPLAHLAAIGCRPYDAYYFHPSGWETDLDQLRRLCQAPGCRALVAVNPNNPTGAYAEASMIDIAARTNQPLIADEVFFPFTLDEAAHQRLAGTTECLTFGLDGLSKLLAAPQLKLGWIRLSGPKGQLTTARRALDLVADSFLSVNALVAGALPTLLDQADASIERIKTRLATNLATANQRLAGLRLRQAAGGWMLLVDLPGLLDPDELALALMDRAGLSVHPGYYYDLPGDTIALSLLPEPAVFAEACQRLTAVLAVLTDELT
ncbi:MAG: pyridoxal phosphate-dependent aminotransferase [Propionibacteriaceae bacterium]|jgi:aspartate/methionine/tyrosine aminotransferase|nr:pyridoxal phosphate-dependent aminotransferase [Propionibacteriaceae bacterium]